MNTIFLLGDTLGQRLALWNVILGICLIIVGVMLFVFSKRIAMIKKNKDNIEANDKMVVTLRAVGLVILVAGLIFMIIQ